MVAAQYYLPVFVKLGPPRFRRFIVDHLPFENTQRLRDVIDIVHETSVEILESKERALKEGDEAVMQQIGRGQDIISILSMYDSNILPLIIDFFHAQSVKTNMEASDEDTFSQSEILGQVNVSSLGGITLYC